MSAAMASCAARFISAGAGKSGKPCERLTALCCRARRVISRITDSVNWPALKESSGLAFAVRGEFDGFIWLRLFGPVKLAIDFRVAADDFDVLASLGKRNRVHKLGHVTIGLAGG